MALSQTDLNALLADLENDRSERKEALGSSNKNKIAEAVCAFANDLPSHSRPGVVFVGVRDDGHVMGLSITDGLLQDLAGLRADGNILPLPQLTVTKSYLTGPDGTTGEVAVVEVAPSPSPPVRYKGQVWIRVGPRRGIATRDEERVLNEKRRWRDLPFDQNPLPSATLEDIDLLLFERAYLPSALAPEVLAENGRTQEQQLASLRLFSRAEAVPTVAGILVVGRSPRDFVPGSYIQFVRHLGPSLTDDIADQREISGPLPDLLKRLDDVLRANVRVATNLTATDREIRRPDYPLAALQQLCRNAIMHRNYETSNAPIRLLWFSDRVEILSPGGPYGMVTAENFGHEGYTDYRNPTLAEAMKNLGYVQRFGVGIATAQRLLKENGNLPATFDVQPERVLARIPALPTPASLV